MEKKLNDEEIVKALAYCNNPDKEKGCVPCPYSRKTKGDIRCYMRRMHNDILDLIHRLQAENQKQYEDYCLLEVENQGLRQENENLRIDNEDLREKNAELQKQVDEWKTYIDFKTANVMCDKCKEQMDELKTVKADYLKDVIEKTEKDTAKKILSDLKEYYYEAMDNTDCAARFDFWCDRYGVEVE